MSDEHRDSTGLAADVLGSILEGDLRRAGAHVVVADLTLAEVLPRSGLRPIDRERIERVRVKLDEIGTDIAKIASDFRGAWDDPKIPEKPTSNGNGTTAPPPPPEPADP